MTYDKNKNKKSSPNRGASNKGGNTSRDSHEKKSRNARDSHEKYTKNPSRESKEKYARNPERISRDRAYVNPEREERTDIIYGRNPVMEALNSGMEIEKILIQKNIEGAGKKVFAMAKKAGIPTQALEKRVLDNIAGSGGHQGVIAEVAEYNYSSVDKIFASAEEKGEKPFIIICDGIEDPHNMGAILRSAEGAGVHGVIIPKRHSAGINGTVIKTSAGAVMHLPVARVSNIASEIEALQKKGVWVYGLDMDGTNYKESKYEAPCALVVGSEGNGISRLVKEKCDFILSIPMRGKTSSLNASNAAAITMYEISSQIWE